MLKKIIAAIVLVMLVGCASIPQQLEQDKGQSLKVVDVHITSPAEPLRYQFDATSSAGMAGGFGLLGAAIGGAIDAGRNAKWKRNAVYLIDSVDDYDHADEMAKKVVDALEQKGLEVLLHKAEPGESFAANTDELAKIVAKTDSDADVFISYDNSLGIGFNLTSTGLVDIYLRSNKSGENGKLKPDARKLLTVSVPIRDPELKEVEEIVADAIANDSEKIKAGLQKSSSSIATQASLILAK